MWDLLFQLIKGYFTHAWPFFVAHLFVAYLISRSLWQIRRETKALEEWGPDPLAASAAMQPAKTPGVLDDFVKETRALGDRGFFVPMTDFSDRLDSIVDGMVGEFHDRTNLFLIVGIAGTLFGVFEFSFRAYRALVYGEVAPGVAPDDRVLSLGVFLSQSMSRAFPVGFVGLVLTFFAQAASGIPEGKLRKALSEATKKALKQREIVIQSQEDNVRLAAERITEAMEPLKDLSQTLTKITTEVLSGFSVQLNESLEVVRSQFGLIKESNKQILGIVGPLQETATGLKTLVKDVPSLMEEQRVSLEKFNRNVDANLELAHQVHSVFLQTADDLNRAAQDLRNLPQGIVDQTQTALHDLRAASLEVWRGMSTDFAQGLQKDYEVLLSNVAAQARDVASAAQAVSAEVAQVAHNANSMVRTLTELPGAVESKISETFTALGKQSLATWEQMSGQFRLGSEESLRNYLHAVQSQAEQIGSSLESAATSWNTIAQSTDTALKSMQEFPGAVGSRMQSTFEELGHNALGVWDGMSDKVGGHILNVYGEFESRARSNMDHVEASLGRAATSWDRIAGSAQQIVEGTFERSVKYAEERIAAGLKQINRVVSEQYPQMSADVQGFSEEFARLLSQVRTVQDEMRAWLDGASKAQAMMQDFHRELARTLEESRHGESSSGGRDVADLLRDNVEQMRETNRILKVIETQGPSTRLQIESALQKSMLELSRIREGIGLLAQRRGVGPKIKGWLGRMNPFGD